MQANTPDVTSANREMRGVYCLNLPFQCHRKSQRIHAWPAHAYWHCQLRITISEWRNRETQKSTAKIVFQQEQKQIKALREASSKSLFLPSIQTSARLTRHGQGNNSTAGVGIGPWFIGRTRFDFASTVVCTTLSISNYKSFNFLTANLTTHFRSKILYKYN